MEHRDFTDTEKITEREQAVPSLSEEIMALDQALLCAVLEAAGTVTVGREDLSRCVGEKRQVRAEYDAQHGPWQLSAREETS